MMTDDELLAEKDFDKLSREQLIRRGWLLQLQETSDSAEFVTFMIEKVGGWQRIDNGISNWTYEKE